MKTLKLDFATYLSEKEVREIREYVKRKFSYRLEDKLILIISDWLEKAKETIKEENKVLEEMERGEVEAIMKAKKEAGVEIHEGRYPNLKVS